LIASLSAVTAVSQVNAKEPGAKLAAPRGTKVELEDGAGKAVALKPEEQVAFLFAHDVKTIEAEVCHKNLKRLCSLEEALKGGKDWTGEALAFTQDPRQDPDYEYLVTSPDGPIEKAKILHVAAKPRRAGLGGFLFVSRSGSYGAMKLFFNPAGAATQGDQEISAYGFQGDSFLRRTQ
jgi:hypothetical protein